MNNTALLRALVIYAVCVPLAILAGYWLMLAVNEETRFSFGVVGTLLLVLCLPILLRWHNPLLLLAWNLPVAIFFINGAPNMFLLMVPVSLLISILQRATNPKFHFVRAPQITLPLCALILVILITAKLTGGFGLRSMGGSVMGGRKYIFLLVGIFGYFALTAQRIPPQRARLYTALFFLSGVASALSDLATRFPIPVVPLLFGEDISMLTARFNPYSTLRFAGVGLAGTAVFTYMLVRHGIRDSFLAPSLNVRLFRMMALFLSFAAIFFGGFRSAVLFAALVFLLQFFLEGLHRTKLLPIGLFLASLTAMTCLPFTEKLPPAVQRSICFLPVQVDPSVRMDAQASLDWRVKMWQAILPEVPQHLLLGTGYAIATSDFQFMGNSAFHEINPAQQALALAGDFHNGPLSVILPFGIWGMVAMVWFVLAGIWALYRNYRYGDPEFKIINTALFALFVSRALMFFFAAGFFQLDIAAFAGYLGFGIALNGGICRRNASVPAPQPVGKPAAALLLQPAFPRQA
ncbi:MAG: O-antigen ligase family protein [Verrucomicrobiota bacterium]|nr:O-antigen ligase family protein [Verrucomicrobiota bacterium]